MDEFYFSLFFGGFIIAVFSLDQFERPSYEPSQELTRLIRVLQPSDLRHRRVYYPAYVFYAGLLVGIYALLCIFGSVPLLKAMGFAIEHASEIEQSAIAPLIISLTMVGLAPAVPVLQRFEERIRFAAHRLSGIPARLLYGCQILNARVLDLPQPGSGLLIADRDWERLRKYSVHAATALNNPDDFARDLPKIIAFRSWFMEQHLVAPAGKRSGILRNEPDLRGRVESLILGLDTLVALPLDEQSRDIWEKYAKEADELARDVCAMIMLYVEHDLVRFLDAGTAESAEARRALEDFIGTAKVWAEDSAVVGALWVRATVVTVVMACLFGIASASTDSVGMMPIQAGPTFALTAFSAYSLSLLVALHLHDHAFRSGSWANMATHDWTRWMGPASGIFVVSGAVSLVCMVALNLYWAMVGYGPEVVFSKFWEAAVQAAAIEAPRALLGPILALGVIATVDHARAKGRQASWLSVISATVTALVLWAVLARGVAAQYGLAQACDGMPECLARVPTLATMLFSEEKLLLAGLQAGAIGTAVLLVCRRTLVAGVTGTPRRIVPSAAAEPRPDPVTPASG